MTARKSKFDPMVHLVLTQVIEMCGAETGHDRAQEAVDLISVCLQAIEEWGYDANDIFQKRWDAKLPEFKAIKAKYDERIGSILQELEKTETRE